MAIVVSGFDGTVVESDWAQLANNAGSRYSVGGNNDFKVTPRSAATLTCDVAAGSAFGGGVKVTSDAQTSVTFGTAPASGIRWDAVVLRRNWAGTGGSASLVVIPGSANRTIPVRNTSPGSLDDQVLALVPITAGQSIPGTPIDCRWFASKVVTVGDLIAIPEPVVGMEAVVLGGATTLDTRWRYQIDATGNPAWGRDETFYAQRNITALLQGQVLATATGWDAFSLDNQAIIDGNRIEVWLEFRRESARIASGANGETTATAACTLTDSLIPNKGIPCIPFTYYGGDVSNPAGTGIYVGYASLNTAGVFTIIQLTPNMYMNVRTADTDISVRAHFSFTRRTPS